MTMKKIAVVGCGGAGKSTFSRKLSSLLNIPVYHLDAMFWRPGWVETPKQEWDIILKSLAEESEWIMDGNYGRTLDIRLKKADTVIFLDMPALLCIYRIIKRRFMYNGKARPDMNEGCREKIDWEFVKWVWNYNKNERPQVIKKLKVYSNEANIIMLKSSSQVEEFLDKLNNRKEASENTCS